MRTQLQNQIPKQLSGTLNHFPQFRNAIFSRNFPYLSRQPHTIFHKSSELNARMFSSSSLLFSSSSILQKLVDLPTIRKMLQKLKKSVVFIGHFAFKHLHTHTHTHTHTHIPKTGIQLSATVPLTDYDPLLSPLSTT